MAYTLDRLLRKLYYTAGLHTAYSSIDNLYKAAKAKHANVHRSQIEDWLLAQDSYTLHKQARRKLSFEPRVHVSGIWAMGNGL